MTKQITEAQFEALKPSNDDLLRTEVDGKYTYVCIDNEDGDEIAFATYVTDEEPQFFLRDAPLADSADVE